MAAKSYKSVILLVFLTCVNIQVQFFQLFGVQYRRCVKHHIAAAIVLREGNAIAYRVETCHDRNKAVKTVVVVHIPDHCRPLITHLMD